MLSIDTNLLFYAYAEDRPEHREAYEWINSKVSQENVAISEFVLVEFYRLLRNPAVTSKPLKSAEAAEVIDSYRSHPSWKLLGFSPRSQEIHSQLFKFMAAPGIAYRRIYDARLALTLRSLGVTEFATCNVKDFQGFGFKKVWNPLEQK